MSGNHRGRRRFYRPEAGSAFLRFLIGLVLLATLCALFFILVLRGQFDIDPVFAQTGTPAQTAEAVPPSGQEGERPVSPAGSTDVPAGPTDAPTFVPTVAPTAKPTDAPSPEPEATPFPPELLAGPMEVVMPDLPEAVSADLKLGLRDLSTFDSGGHSILTVRGYAYIEGADAAQSRSYILLTDAASGAMLGMFSVMSTPEDADTAFAETEGVNLDQSFFRLNLDVSDLYDGIYLLSMAVENGGAVVWNNFDDSMFHFYVAQGVAMLNE